MQAEIDGAKVDERLSRLEDPISQLHPDVPKLSEILFEKLRVARFNNIELDEAQRAEFARPLATLESQLLIRGDHSTSGRFAHGLTISDPTFMLYMCSRFEDPDKMELLVSIVDACRLGEQLRAQDIMQRTGLSNPIVVCVFKLYAAKGYGTCGRERGDNQIYLGQA